MVISVATTPFRAIAVRTGTLVGNFPLSSLANQANRAGWGYLFSDLYQTGAVARPALEMAARTIARTVLEGDLHGANQARTSMVADLMEPSRLGGGIFSTDASYFLAQLRRKFERSYGIGALGIRLDKLAHRGPQWESFFTSAEELIDRIVDNRHHLPKTRDRRFAVLERIVKEADEGLSPIFLGGLLTQFHQNLDRGGPLSAAIIRSLKREKEFLQLIETTDPIGKPGRPDPFNTGNLTPKEAAEIFSRVAEVEITVETLGNALRSRVSGTLQLESNWYLDMTWRFRQLKWDGKTLTGVAQIGMKKVPFEVRFPKTRQLRQGSKDPNDLIDTVGVEMIPPGSGDVKWRTGTGGYDKGYDDMTDLDGLGSKEPPRRVIRWDDLGRRMPSGRPWSRED